ncbi:hypothetical protein FQA39_LY04582 [Lamprigera yunnana]|nr:hypothetical protein FQA39_LY04582 [Lamprigera yunnana]
MSEGGTFPTTITINPPYEDVHAETDKNSNKSGFYYFISIVEKRSIIATSSKERRIRKELKILEKGKAVNFQVVNVPIPEQPNDNVLLKSLLNPIIPYNKFSPDEFLEVIVYKIKLYSSEKS